MREEACCCQVLGYSFQLGIFLYAPSHRQNSTPDEEHWLEQEIATQTGMQDKSFYTLDS